MNKEQLDIKIAQAIATGEQDTIKRLISTVLASSKRGRAFYEGRMYGAWQLNSEVVKEKMEELGIEYEVTLVQPAGNLPINVPNQPGAGPIYHVKMSWEI